MSFQFQGFLLVFFFFWRVKNWPERDNENQGGGRGGQAEERWTTTKSRTEACLLYKEHSS